MVDPAKYESKEQAEEQPNGDYQIWLSEIQAAEKELEKWKRSGRKIVKEFRAEHNDAAAIDTNFQRRFNLFSANTQIMQAALLNQIPKPTADRMFKDSVDDVARVAARILERALEYQATKNTRMYDILCATVQDNLVPGVGLSWHTYHAEIEEREEPPTPEQLALDPESKPLKYEEVVAEELVDEYVYWEDILWSPSRTWEEVRWIARKTYMTRDQLVKRFGAEKGKEVGMDYTPKKNDVQVDVKNSIFSQAVIYEIWDIKEKEVYWISKSYEGILDEKDDFLGLRDFLPCPKPLFATTSNGQLIPIPDYNFARDQYRELNDINTRISLLVRACRVAGVYDKAAGQVTAVLSTAAENVLVPVDSWAMFAEKGGLKGAIDWIPLEQIVKTIDQLLKAREDVKVQIYEVTGMSDIIRGASKASETLGAQKIKAQYASMRIQTRQKNVAIYASQVFDIQGQLICKHMDPQEIIKMAQADQMQEDPQLIQAALELMKSPDFYLRVQVESDTLSDIDFQAERDARMEYMQAISIFLKENGGMMMNDPVMGPFLAQLLQFSLVGFRVGKKFEGQLDATLRQLQQQLAQPKPPQPSPEEQKAQAEIQVMREEAQLNTQGKQQELQFKGQEQQIKLQGKQQEAAVTAQARQQKTQQENFQFAQKMRQAAMENQQKMIQQAQAAGPGQPPVQ